MNVPQGWQCPVCRYVYAPWMAMCTRCKEAAITNTVAATNTMHRCLAHNPDYLMQQCVLIAPHYEVPHRWSDSA